MSQYRFLSRHTCQNVPSSLYRVQHPESQARFDDHGDLVARSAQELPDNEEDLKTQLEGHFRWGYSRRDSSFMSLLDSRNRAINWGKSRYRAQSRGLDTSNAKVNVYRVFPTEMPNAYIFKAEELCNWLDIRLNRDIAGEFLIASRIPAAAMRCIADIEALIYEEEEARAEAWQDRQRANNPVYHYVDDLGGFYDTDEEAEEHNLNDDLMKMVEGDWD